MSEAFFRRCNRRKKNEVNIIPLVDVLIILIFFFLMTMQFRNLSVLNLTLPNIETAGSNALKDNIILAVDREGHFFMNDQPIAKPNINEALKLASSLGQEQSILILADENTPLHDVTFLMDACRKNQLERIRLQSR